MNPYHKFVDERTRRIESNHFNAALVRSSNVFITESIKADYSYNFEWQGRPIIQYPQDIIGMQELIWQVGHDLGEF